MNPNVYSNPDVYVPIVYAVILSILGVLVIIGLYLLALWNSAKKEVQKTPREPMLMCDTHGAYPARHSMKMEVPGALAPMDVCPSCVNDRVSKKVVPIRKGI